MSNQIEALPSKLFGLTVDNVEHADRIVAALKKVTGEHPPVKPIVRVVFDFDQEIFKKKKYRFSKEDFIPEAEVYKAALEQLTPHAFIMGELVDSSDLYRCHYDPDRTHTYVERTKAYAETLRGLVNIWEIGNEINGEWVGWRGGAWEDTNLTIQQMAAVRQRVRDELSAALTALKDIIPNALTAMTFYFNDDSVGRHSWTDEQKRNEQTGKLEKFGQDYAMPAWAKECRSLFADVNFIFISYYQDDSYFGVGKDRKQIVPTGDEWANIFRALHAFYPHAQLGFGECAPQCHYLPKKSGCAPLEIEEVCVSENDPELRRGCRCCLDAQPEYIKRYYVDWDEQIRKVLKESGPENLYVGGYFYWYFKDDVVNQNNTRTIQAFQKAFAGWYAHTD